MRTIAELKSSLPYVGRLEWIGVSPSRLSPIVPLESVVVEVGTGLAGDHHATSGLSARQVTLIQKEHLPVIAALSQRETVEPELLRRNLVIAGINLLALKGRRFRIGSVELEGTGPCILAPEWKRILARAGITQCAGMAALRRECSSAAKFAWATSSIRSSTTH